MRRYGRGAFQPSGYFCLASSSETEPAMITSSPCCQFTGVATLCFAVSWRESMTRNTSSKFLPVALGLLDVVRPARMVVDRIDAKPHSLDIPLVKFRLQLGHVTELGGAHRRE